MARRRRGEGSKVTANPLTYRRYGEYFRVCSLRPGISRASGSRTQAEALRGSRASRLGRSLLYLEAGSASHEPSGVASRTPRLCASTVRTHPSHGELRWCPMVRATSSTRSSCRHDPARQRRRSYPCSRPSPERACSSSGRFRTTSQPRTGWRSVDQRARHDEVVAVLRDHELLVDHPRRAHGRR